MEEGKKFIRRLTGGRKLQKDQCLIMILVGILLCVIVIPVEKKNSKSDLSNTKSATIDNHTDTGQEITETDYVRYWETKLEETLRYVEGMGKVRVLITLRSSEQKIVEKDGPEEYSNTAEADAAGGSRTVEENRTEKSTIYTTDREGSTMPYVVRTIPPVVEGVVVIAQMKDQKEVQANIIEAIQVLFDIDANKIKIVKMKNNQ